MDDSDDYVFDDIVLDDQTLAVLDEEERKYKLRTENSVSTPSTTIEPPNKRLRTDSGWSPGIGSSLIRETDDDLPEISLHGDGSYAIGHHINRPQPRNIPQQKLERHVRLGGIQHAPNVAPPRHVPHLQPGPAHLPYQGNVRQHPIQNVRTQNQAQQSVNRVAMQNSAHLQAQMAELQKKLDELREDNSKMQATLKNALDAKFSKEGEVTILRKNIEKNAQNHAAQIALYKSEKEKADAQQLQMQKHLKDEMERLRTQYVFRQQELESSARKLPASVRAKKVPRDFPSTPLAVPAAMSSWRRGSSDAASSRRQDNETPVRPSRPPPTSKVSPMKPPRRSPEKYKKADMLPGFENAFDTSTPLRTSPKKSEKGKGKMIQDSNLFAPDLSRGFRPLSQISQGHTQQSRESAACHPQLDNFLAPAPTNHVVAASSQLNDEDMDILPLESDEDVLAEEVEMFEPINWKAELCRVVLTHSNSVTGQNVFQQLINSSQSIASPASYSAACAKILEVVAHSAQSDDYQDSIRTVAGSLIGLAAELSAIEQLASLAGLFGLLSKLVLVLPDFQQTFLSSRLPLEGAKLISFLDIITTLIMKHLEPASVHPQRDEFAAESVSLLEALCFREPQESGEQISIIASNREVLMVLLHISQPVWLLERSMRLLVLLSTHHNLYKLLLKFPNTAEDQAYATRDSSKDLFIEALCSHLTDASRSPTENLKIYILTYFAQISIAHSDVHTLLGASYSLIPSLIIYISHLTTPLWEDDDTLASSAEATSSLIQALNQTIFLLYHLIFGAKPSLNLRHKLQHTSHRQFNSINHIFIVTFGRLSYCDVPSWIDVGNRHDLEFLSEMSREILEVVIDGPEGDSVWLAFQDEPGDENAIDEEEMEAQLIGVDL